MLSGREHHADRRWLGREYAQVQDGTLVLL